MLKVKVKNKEKRKKYTFRGLFKKQELIIETSKKGLFKITCL